MRHCGWRGGDGSLDDPGVPDVLGCEGAPLRRLRYGPCTLCATGAPGSTKEPTMARFINLNVWHQARTLLRMVSDATRTMRAEGDLKSQMRRAAISVVSNISEGSERGNDREFRHVQARASPRRHSA
jgi:hypothetical protein